MVHQGRVAIRAAITITAVVREARRGLRALYRAVDKWGRVNWVVWVLDLVGLRVGMGIVGLGSFRGMVGMGIVVMGMVGLGLG